MHTYTPSEEGQNKKCHSLLLENEGRPIIGHRKTVTCGGDGDAVHGAHAEELLQCHQVRRAHHHGAHEGSFKRVVLQRQGSAHRISDFGEDGHLVLSRVADLHLDVTVVVRLGAKGDDRVIACNVFRGNHSLCVGCGVGNGCREVMEKKKK